MCYRSRTNINYFKDKVISLDKEIYKEIIHTVINQIAQKFFDKETNLVQRSIFLDADIAEITRGVGLETTRIVYEKLERQITSKKKQRD